MKNDDEKTAKAPVEGWGFPGLSRKAHYFVKAESLCRKWLFGGRLELGDAPSPDDCRECRKKRDASVSLSVASKKKSEGGAS